MKRSRHFAFIMMLIFSTTFFYSCSEDDDPVVATPSINGVWEIHTIEFRNAQNLDGLYNPLIYGLLSWYYEFGEDENQTFLETNQIASGEGSGLSFQRTGEWEFNDDETELTIFYDQGENETYDVDELSVGKLVLSRTEPFDPDNDPATPNTLQILALYTYYKVTPPDQYQ
ncbi:MAG: lipocalin family protein [Candidatus Cyclobacteriaceae bacterium M3_2C_046]